MKTKIIAFIAGALFAASTMPSTAAEAHKARKAGYATSEYSETFRRSNAYVAPRDVEAPRLSGSQLNGAMSAPAGR